MRRIWICAVLLLCGCGRWTSQPALPGPAPAGQPPAATLPSGSALPFPEDRVASTLTEHKLLGVDTQLRSAGAVADGSALSLSAGSDPEFAVYEFGALLEPAEHVDIVLDSTATQNAWIGVANFTTQRWQFSGPHTASTLLPLTAQENISPHGNVYVAVLASSGTTARIEQLQLFTADSPPLAVLRSSVASGEAPLTVSFDASESVAADGPVASYAWDWDGDGVYDESTFGPKAAHNYGVDGTFATQLKVFDDRGLSATTSLTLDVAPHVNQPPIAQFTYGPPGSNSVVLDAGASYDTDGQIVKYEWDLDNDSVFELDKGSVSTQPFAIPAPPNYAVVRLRVTDNSGATDIRVMSVGKYALTIQSVPGGPEPGDSMVEVSPGVYDIKFGCLISGGDPGYSVEFNPDYYGAGYWQAISALPINTTDPMDPVNGYPTNGSHFPTVRVTPPAPGAFAFALRVTDIRPSVGGDLSQVYIYPHLVNYGTGGAGSSTLSASFTASTLHGPPGGAVLLDASGSTDLTGNIVKYEWDLDGDGSYETDAGPSPTQTTTLPDPAGTVNVGLRVTDDHGYSTVAAQQLSSLPLLWTVSNVGAAQHGEYCSLALIDGQPAISCYDGPNNCLRYFWSDTIVGPRRWYDLNPDGYHYLGQFTSLAAIGGQPGISYFDYANLSLKYTVRTKANGIYSWTPTVVDSAAYAGTGSSLAQIAGRPAIAYYNYVARDLNFAYSDMADGSAAWHTVTIDSQGDVGQGASLASVFGHPAISYFDTTNGQLKYALASSTDGASGWQTIVIDAAAGAGVSTSLAVVNGHPAIGYADTATHSLKFSHSFTVTGAWGWDSLVVDGVGPAPAYSSLKVVDGQPALGYYDSSSGELKYAHGVNADGAGPWITQVVASGGQAAWTSLISLSTGVPALAYYDTAAQRLKYAEARW